MTVPLYGVTLAAALGSGVIAGVFFAFSALVMKALGRLSVEQGISVMQSINAAAITPVFMAALFGTALACGVLTVSALLAWNEPFAVYLLLGGALYLVGAILLTGLYHVPRNEALAKVEPHAAEARSHWASYLSGWTAWNHLRAAASLAAAATLTVALHIG